MSPINALQPSRALLSFSNAYAELASRLKRELAACGIDVVLDQWSGGRGSSTGQAQPLSLENIDFLLPLLTPSDAAPTWIGEEWRQKIYVPAGEQQIVTLPIRGEECKIPDFLAHLSFADLRFRNYELELYRLVETVKKRSESANIRLPNLETPMLKGGLSQLSSEPPLVVEMGEKEASVFDVNRKDNRFTAEMVPMMRQGLFYELGVRFPPLEICLTDDVPDFRGRVVINGIPEELIEIRPQWLLINERVELLQKAGFIAEPAVNPANGLACAWIPADQAADVLRESDELTTWDPQAFVILSLSAILRRKAAAFIGIETAVELIRMIEPQYPLLVAETVPKTVSWFLLTDVLRRLVAEEISIRNLHRILMALTDWGRTEDDPLYLTEYVRGGLQKYITHKYSRGQNELIVLLLHPNLEDKIQKSMKYTATGSYVDLPEEELNVFLKAVGEPLKRLPEDVQTPVILTTLEIRSIVRRLISFSFPHVAVLSYQELHPKIDIQPLGRISSQGFKSRQVIYRGRTISI